MTVVWPLAKDLGRSNSAVTGLKLKPTTVDHLTSVHYPIHNVYRPVSPFEHHYNKRVNNISPPGGIELRLDWELAIAATSPFTQFLQPALQVLISNCQLE